MNAYAHHLGSPTPQSEPLPGQVSNSAGGFSFQVDDWQRLDRFLILGSEGGTYYAGERELTLDNAEVVRRCVAADGVKTVARIVAVSDEGRAVKNDPAIVALVLAMKHGDDRTRSVARAALPKVVRIPTHLFHWAELWKSVGGGWGRGTRKAVARWYDETPVARLALHAVKYQQRDGWSHRDVLRLSHPQTDDETRNAVYNWMVKGWPSIGPQVHPDPVLQTIWAHERAKTADKKELIRLISEHGLPHECVPNEHKGDPAVWEAMLPSMGLTALVRNLGKMTSIGLLAPLSTAVRKISEKLSDVDQIRGARLHPMSILVALRVYQQGHGVKGDLTWRPVQAVVDALDAAFYKAFKAVEPTGRRHLLAVDVSGSMAKQEIAGLAGITPRVAAAAMSLVTAAVEPNHHFLSFSCGPAAMTTGYASRERLKVGVEDLEISPRMSLDAVVKKMDDLPFGGTDCALPMVWATKNKVPVDVFVVLTDGETWHGPVHPAQALRDYRQKMGIPAKLVVVGMTASEFTIADPEDFGTMDVCGLDTSTPALIADFAR